VYRNTFLDAIRSRTSITPSIRETIICRIAVLNKAWYEWDQHLPLLQQCEGITDDYIAWVRTSLPKDVGAMFDERHEIAMLYTDFMTKEVEVPDLVFERVKNKFSETEIVEMTAIAAAYNCVSRFLVALNVGEKNGEPAPVGRER
jgi:alkylhydroperoxidase family enzyme